MGCNCKPKNYNFSMGCCQPVLGPIENYYTKSQTDRVIEEAISGITGSTGCCITPEEVDEKINEATSGITEALTEKQDTLIPGDNITIDSANTISTSGLVTVVDNEVEPYKAITTSSPKYVTDMPAPPDSFSYADAPDSLHIEKYESSFSWDNTFKFGLINENGDTVSGASYVSGTLSAESTVPTALTGYMSAVSATTTDGLGRGGDYKTKDGWRISWVYAYADHSGGGHGYDIYVPITVFSGGQSSYVIENSIEPEIIRFEKETNDRLNGKQKLIYTSYPLDQIRGELSDNIVLRTTSAITEIDEYTPFYEKNLIPTNEAVYRAISGITTSGITSAECQTMIDESISGKADTSDVYTKTEVYNKTEVDNKVSVKPNVWCGNESEWSQISGSTESGTIYLVY